MRARLPYLLALPLAYFEARRVGDTVARVRELHLARVCRTLGELDTDQNRGGWRYSPDDKQSDMSATVWQQLRVESHDGDPSGLEALRV